MAILDFDDAHIIMAASIIIHATGPAGVGITVAYGHTGYLAHAIMHAYHHAARQGEVCKGEYGCQDLFHAVQNYNVF
jgi:hypothetical protein